jgi:ABC-type sugar transport system permease subunit/ABC-type glycerol-3-phosphate transport system substrate-binding protein
LSLKGALVLAGFIVAAIGRAQTTLSVWGAQLDPDSIAGTLAVAQAFELSHPGVKVRMLGMGAGHMNPQKLLTAIVGGSPPDLVYQARFNISDWASRGAFIPLDRWLRRDATDPDCPKRSDYYDAAWSEAMYGGMVYGIPTGADDRALYWNKQIFRENKDALAKRGLDWTRPPRTWSELLAYSKALTVPGKRAGFIPNFGNSWLYLYAFQNDGRFLSLDGKTCTLATPETAEALAFMRKGYDILGGYDQTSIFQSSFQGNESDPFIVGQVAMKIDGDWSLPGLARYGPNVDFGVAPAPIPDDRYAGIGRFKHDKDKFITWIGGFSYAMPKGCPHPDLSWEFIKFATSLKGRLVENRGQAISDHGKGRLYLPRLQGLKAANVALYKLYKPADPKFAEGLRVHAALMDHARIRPPSIVGQLLWDEHVRATEEALRDHLSPMAALREGQATVQRELDRQLSKNRYPKASSTAAWVTLGGVGLALLLVWRVSWKRTKLGLLARKEARWGLFCIAPWLLGFLVLTAEPMLASIFLSFTDYDVLSPPRLVGLRNYADMFGPDRTNLLKAFENAFYLAGIGVPLGLMTGLAMALLLNAGGRGIRVYRTIYYLPAIVPVVAASVLWIWLLTPDPNKGLINSVWVATIGKWMNLAAPGWLSSETWAKPSLILMGLWGAGSGMILWLAGLKGVPATLYEAAEIDGAGASRAFFHITLPMISPILFFNLVMGFIGAIQEFDRVYIMSPDGGNGPSDALLVPAKLLFTNAFSYFKMGYASALAWTIFAVVLAITLIQFSIAPRWVHEESGP